MADLAREIGWYSVPIPELAVDATAEIVARLPFLPDEVRLDRGAAQARPDGHRTGPEAVGWKPEHTAKQTLKQLVAAYRSEERVGH